jgi:hypothetical protein
MGLLFSKCWSDGDNSTSNNNQLETNNEAHLLITELDVPEVSEFVPHLTQDMIAQLEAQPQIVTPSLVDINHQAQVLLAQLEALLPAETASDYDLSATFQFSSAPLLPSIVQQTLETQVINNNDQFIQNMINANTTNMHSQIMNLAFNANIHTNQWEYEEYEEHEPDNVNPLHSNRQRSPSG